MSENSSRQHKIGQKERRTNTIHMSGQGWEVAPTDREVSYLFLLDAWMCACMHIKYG